MSAEIIDEGGVIVARQTVVLSIGGRRCETAIEVRVSPIAGWGPEVSEAFRASVAGQGGVDWQSGEAKQTLGASAAMTASHAVSRLVMRELYGQQVPA